MGDLSVSFNRSEFACKCGCGGDTVDAELINALQDLRSHFNSPLIVTSGFRCEEHNRTIGGAKNSKHLKGRAADFIVSGVTCDDVYCYLLWKYPDRFGIKNYGGWIHLDTRSNERWRG